QPLFLLKTAGPLIERFRALGPVFILAEGWNLDGLVQGLPSACPALVNTGAAADLALPLAKAGRACLLLLHEMPDYLRQQDLLPKVAAAQAAGAAVIASMPAMVAQMDRDLGPLACIRPGLPLPPVSLT